MHRFLSSPPIAGVPPPQDRPVILQRTHPHLDGLRMFALGYRAADKQAQHMVFQFHAHLPAEN